MAKENQDDPKNIEIVTLRYVYHTPGETPYPIGTKLLATKQLADFWEKTGIARRMDAPVREEVLKSATKPEGVIPAEPPKAPEMKPPPAQNGPGGSATA